MHTIYIPKLVLGLDFYYVFRLLILRGRQVDSAEKNIKDNICSLNMF